MTTEWAALVTRLDIRFTGDRNSLDAEQAAAPGPLGGNYYAAARDRFIGYVDSYWNYSYNETVIWSNSSSLTFRQADVTVLLDDYRVRWLTHVDVFVNNLPGDPGGNVFSTISADMRAAINSGYNDTLDLLRAWLVQWVPPATLSKIQGSWTSGYGELSITIQMDGNVLGYDERGCQFEGAVVTNAWLDPDFRIIMKRDCGAKQKVVSGMIFMANHSDESSILIDAASESSHFRFWLTR